MELPFGSVKGPARLGFSFRYRGVRKRQLREIVAICRGGKPTAGDGRKIEQLFSYTFPPVC